MNYCLKSFPKRKS